MTDPVEQLAEIRERAEKATPGPWFFANAQVWSKPAIDASFDREEALGPNPTDEQLDSLPDTPPLAWVPVVAGDTETKQGGLDGDFIAHARKDIPALLAMIEEWNSEFTQLEQQVKMMADLEGDKWKANMLDATGTMLRLWFLEGVPRLKQDHRKERDRADKLEKALQQIREQLNYANSSLLVPRSQAIAIAFQVADAALATEAPEASNG